MKLSPVALAVSAAFVWGAAIFVIGGLNSFVPGYGDAVLSLVVSIYPGFDADGSLPDLLLGTAYAAFDGLAAGFVFALLYNAVAHLAAPATIDNRRQAEDSAELDEHPGPEGDAETDGYHAPEDGPETNQGAAAGDSAEPDEHPEPEDRPGP